jgi:hypothetical protein
MAPISLALKERAGIRFLRQSGPSDPRVFTDKSPVVKPQTIAEFKASGFEARGTLEGNGVRRFRAPEADG